MTRQSRLAGLLAVVALTACTTDVPVPVEKKVDAARSTVEVNRSGGVLADGKDAVEVTVTVRDAQGKPLAGMAVLLSAGGEEVALTDAPPTDGAGASRATLTSTRAQTVTLMARVGAEGVELSQKPAVQFVAGAATGLAFLVPPSAVEAGAVLTPAVQVAVLDAHGNRVLGNAAEVTLSLEGGDGTATLLGKTIGDASEGVAAFNELRIVKPGTGYVLVASSEGLVSVRSPAFDVTAGPPANLSFIKQPVDAVAGANLAPVSIEFQDAVGNRVLGSTPVTLALGTTAGAATLGGTRTVTPIDGVATFAALNVQKAGTGYTLVASAHGFANAESDTFDIAPASIDPSRSSLSAIPASAVADGAEVITFVIKAEDTFGNVLPGLTVGLSSSEATDAIAPASGTTDGSGSFSAALTSTKVGERTITADVVGHLLTAHVRFTPGAASAANTTLTASKTTVTADGSDATTLTVVVKDASGTPIANQAVSLSSTGSANTWTSSSGTTDGAGLFAATLTSIRAESKTITATSGSVELTAAVTFVPGAASAANTTFTASKPSVTADGSDAATLTATVKDANGNPIANQGVSLSSSGSANTLSQSSGTTDGWGVFVATLTSTKPESKTVTATIGAFSKTVTMSFGPGAASAANTTLTTSKTTVTADGSDAATLTATVKDANGNPIANQAVSISSSGSANTLTPSSGTTDDSGLFVTTLTSTKAESKTVTATIGSVAKTVAIGFVPGAVDYSMLLISPTEVVANGSASMTLTLTIRDANENPIEGQAVSFGATGSANVFSASTGATNRSGVFSSTLKSTKAELKTVTATFGSLEIASPVTFLPGAASASNTTLTASKTTLTADGSDAATLTVVVQDVNGNPVTNQAVSLNSSGSANTVTPSSGRTDASGHFVATLTSTRAESKTVTATIGAFTKAATVSFVPGAASAANTTLTASKPSVTANGSDAATLTVVVQDANGNPLAAQAVALSSSGSANTLTPSSGTTDASGHFTATLTSTRAESKTVTATIGSVTRTEAIVFVPGAPDAAQSSAFAAPASVPADGVSTSAVSVAVRDAYGNSVVGAAVSISASGTGNVLTQPTVSDSSGMTSGTLASTVAETKTVLVAADGIQLVDVPQVTFTNPVPRSIGGTITGLVGSGLVLENDGGDPLVVAASGAFTFNTKLLFGSPYAVTVSSQPSNQACAVLGGVGVVGLSDVTDVVVKCGAHWERVVSSSNALHTLGIRTDGTLWAWGYNEVGQLGDGSKADRFSPVQVGTHFASVAVGGYHSLGIKTDGTLWAWGWNGNGQLGDGTNSQRSSPVLVGTGFASVAAGVSHTVAVKTDGTLWAWGWNSHGQLGDGTMTQHMSPVLVGSGFASVAAGGTSTVAVKVDGTLWAWGENSHGQLGDGTTTQHMSPVLVGTGFASVAAAKSHTFAVKADGTLWAWGDNVYGQLGDGTTTRRSSPVLVGSFASVAAGNSNTVAVKADGTLWAWGSNFFGQIGDGTTTPRASPVHVGTGFASVAAGLSHTVAVKTDGTLWSWGDNYYGQLGNGSMMYRTSPVQIGMGFARVSAGLNHTAAVKADGTLWTWGNNAFGRLGDGTMTQRTSPVQVGTGFASIAAGCNHTLGIKTDGSLWAWGYNGAGQLGDGTTTHRFSPVQVGTGFASVYAGTDHTLGIKTDGTLWAWGWNSNGQLGDGSKTQRSSAVQVGTGFASVSAGGSHTVAIKTDGTLWAWGRNGHGQLGDGTLTERTSPVQVGMGFASVTASRNHTLAVKIDGTLWAWGDNGSGQLGDGSTTQHTSPVLVGAGFASVSAGNFHTVAVATDGTLWTWGSNGDGELGDGTRTPRALPVQVGTGFASVAAGGGQSLAIKTDGMLWAWGSNGYGQLGNGEGGDQLQPEFVP